MVALAGSVFGGPDEQGRRIKESRGRCLAAGAVEYNGSSLQDTDVDAGAGLSGWCPMAWDGLACWNATRAGQVASQFCPSYIAGFDQQANATKRCLEDGSWFINQESGRTWTNFSQCYGSEMATVVVSLPESANNSLLATALPIVKTMSQVGYTVSLITLVAASAVLATIKKLRCPRNMLHLHLFASFIMRAFVSLLKSGLFVDGIGLPSDLLQKDGVNFLFVARHENWVCKLFTSLWQYFIMANYSWILMEGLYLHNLIFLALFSDTSSISLYVALGWGLPSVFVAAWVVARSLLEDTLCWTTHNNSKIFLLVRIPITVSILLNFVLFVNIIRMLMQKLQASICDETRRHRRWAKSTLVLVPLFGAHYALFLGMSYRVHTGMDTSDGELVETIWLFLDQAFASFQGFFVAILFCFLNGEVRVELDKEWSSRRPLCCRGRRFWLKSRSTRQPSLHSYATCSSYGHQVPWAIRKRSEGRNTVTSTSALPSERSGNGSSITKPEEVPLSLAAVKEGVSASSQF